MGLFNSIFGSSTFDENNLVKAYKSQSSLRKYDFKTFSFLECSKHNISPETFFDIFMKAHEILNQKKTFNTRRVLNIIRSWNLP